MTDLTARLHDHAKLHLDLSQWDDEEQKQYADDLFSAIIEIMRLTEICRDVHDRILRGDDDMSLMDKLEKAWKDRTHSA